MRIFAVIIALAAALQAAADLQAAGIILERLDTASVTVLVVPDSLSTGACELSVHGGDGELRGAITVDQRTGPFTVRVPVDFSGIDPVECFLRWRLAPAREFEQSSLSRLVPSLEIHAFHPRRWSAGDTTLVVAHVRERAIRQPAEAARVHLELVKDKDVLARAAATADEQGLARLRVAVPLEAIGRCEVRITATGNGRHIAQTTAIDVAPVVRTLLVCDRPLYRPGQVIHARALSLAGRGLVPVAGDTAVFTLQGPDTRHSLRDIESKTVVTDEHGLAFTSFALGDPIPDGRYQITVTGGTIARTSRSVRVERYIVPRWRLAIELEQPSVSPRDSLRGAVEARYHVGGALPGGDVQLNILGSFGGASGAVTAEGALDENGRWRFAVPIPPDIDLRGEREEATLRLSATVTGLDGHTQQAQTSVQVVEQPLSIAISTPGGRLEPDLENTLTLRLFGASQGLVAGSLRWIDGPRGAHEIVTDHRGLADLQVAPIDLPHDGRFTFLVQDAHGRHARLSAGLPVSPGPGMRLKIPAQASRSVNVEVATPYGAGEVVAVLLDRDAIVDQTVLARRGGSGPYSGRLNVPAGTGGALNVEAIWLRAGHEPVARAARVLVPRSDHLDITVRTDRPTHAPGDTLGMQIRVRDRRGTGVPAVLGGSLVDQALLQLATDDPSAGATYFDLIGPLTRFSHERSEFAAGLRELLLTGRSRAVDNRLLSVELLEHRLDPAVQVAGSRALNVLGPYNSRRHLPLLWLSFQHIDAAVARLARKWQTADTGEPVPTRPSLTQLVLLGGLDRRHTIDPWGTPYRLSLERWGDEYFLRRLDSAGIDRRWNTPDDLSFALETIEFIVFTKDPGDLGDWPAIERRGSRWYWLLPEGRTLEEIRDSLEPFDVEAGRYMVGTRGGHTDSFVDFDTALASTFVRFAFEGLAEPRLRSDFRETAWWDPRILTDAHGRARVEVVLPDSRTRWRLRALASDRFGRLGEIEDWLDTDLSFHLDMAPVGIATQGDRVAIPVLITNGLGLGQQVHVRREARDGAVAHARQDTVLMIDAGQAVVVDHPVAFEQPGEARLTVTARAPAAADAVERPVAVRPAGRPAPRVWAGMLSGETKIDVTLPAGRLPGTAAIELRVEPDLAAQAQAVLPALHKLPRGCFEQLTSVLRMQALALRLQEAAGAGPPDDAARAAMRRDLQSLAYFEHREGGFGWFGGSEPDHGLAAVALLAAHELAPVVALPSDLARRTLQSLQKGQRADGAWRDPGDRHADTVRLQQAAFIAWALAETGHHDAMLDRALAYLARSEWSTVDPGTLAMAALAQLLAAPDSEAGKAMIDALAARAETVDRGARWRSTAGTTFGGRGSSADIETTALAIQALARQSGHDALVGRALAWLVAARRPDGLWGTTQATLQVFRALEAVQGGRLEPVAGTLTVESGGKRVFDDLLEGAVVLDLGAEPGPVRLQWRGQGRPLWLVRAASHVGWDDPEAPADSPDLRVAVRSGRAVLSSGEVVDVGVEVTWSGDHALMMPTLTMDLAPGLVPLLDALDAQQRSGAFNRWEQNAERLTFYFRSLPAGSVRTVTVPMIARWTGDVQVGASHVWAYYDPDTEARSAPVRVRME